MKCISYYNLTENQRKIFFDFLQKIYHEKLDSAYENMWSDDWQSKPNTLPYILEKSNRFNNGDFTVLFDNYNVIACSGVYQSNFCDDIAIAGVRTWIDKNYRNKLISREILLPNEKLWAVKNRFKAIALTFNEYNKNLIKLWQRKRLGEVRPTREEHHFGFSNLNLVPFPVKIQHTKQYIIYEILNQEFKFNWETIKFQEDKQDQYQIPVLEKS